MSTASMLEVDLPVALLSVVVLTIAILLTRRSAEPRAPLRHPASPSAARHRAPCASQAQLLRLAELRETAREAVRTCGALLAEPDEDDPTPPP